MEEISDLQQSLELLQKLGLKEYEAKSFVALSRLSGGTAKEIAEVSDVPRTRVYDAIRVLETKGLVETQHSNPQVFRAVAVDEAAETLRTEYEQRTESLRDTLRDVEPVEQSDDTTVTHEVWSLSGETAITRRTQQLVEEAEEEIVIVIGRRAVITDGLVESLNEANQRGVTLVIGTIDEAVRDALDERIPDVATFVSELEWLTGSATIGDETEISRLLLIDGSTILVSSFHEQGPDGLSHKQGPDGLSHEQGPDGLSHEQAVFGRGFDNGIVTIVRRLMSTGLVPEKDPQSQEEAEF